MRKSDKVVFYNHLVVFCLFILLQVKIFTNYHRLNHGINATLLSSFLFQLVHQWLGRGSPSPNYQVGISGWYSSQSRVTLNKSFIAACLFGESVVSEKRLLEPFLVDLSRDKRELVGVSLKNELNEEHEEEWLELRYRFWWKTIPKAGEAREVILEIAHRPAATSSTAGAHPWLLIGRELSSSEVLLEVFSPGTPTNRKLIALFEAEAETNALCLNSCGFAPVLLCFVTSKIAVS